MKSRSTVRLALTVLSAPLLVVLYLNIEKLAEREGWDTLLADGVAPASGPSPLLELLTTPTAFAAATFVIGLAIGVWIDTLLVRRERLIGPPVSPNPDKIARINEHVAEIFKTIGMAIGAEDRLHYDLAIAQCESFLLDLSRRNNIHIPELRADGTEAGTLRVLCYLNELLPVLQLDDDVEARARASRLVPKLNAKTADELRSELGIERVKPAVQPPVSSSLSSSNSRADKPHYEYPKAVLQVALPKVMRMAHPDGQLSGVEGALVIKNDCYMDLKQCEIMLVSVTYQGISQTVMRPVRAGRKPGGEMDSKFTIKRQSSRPIRLIHRDLVDVVSKPPFLLALLPDRMPLQGIGSYRLLLELQSEYEHPTRVNLEINIGHGPELEIILQDQSVLPQ